MTKEAVLEKETSSSEHWANGRRKEATARVRLIPGDGSKFIINDKPLEVYFPRLAYQVMAQQSLKAVKLDSSFNVVVSVAGGGHSGQACAVRLGIARALLLVDPALRKGLRQAGFLTRDPRAKERKKYGRRGARRGIQYSKR